MTERVAQTEKAPARTGCSSHCRACGTHFSSDKAFDLHRRGRFDLDTRHCIEPADDPEHFEVRSDDGVCKVADPLRPENGVQIWTVAGAKESYQRMRDAA